MPQRMHGTEQAQQVEAVRISRWQYSLGFMGEVIPWK